jgi:hypothetical protein
MWQDVCMCRMWEGTLSWQRTPRYWETMPQLFDCFLLWPTSINQSVCATVDTYYGVDGKVMVRTVACSG